MSGSARLRVVLGTVEMGGQKLPDETTVSSCTAQQRFFFQLNLARIMGMIMCYVV